MDNGSMKTKKVIASKSFIKTIKTERKNQKDRHAKLFDKIKSLIKK